jgi:hypothetical protein
MALTPKDEDDLVKSQKASAKEFSEAAKELKNAAKGVQKNSLRQQLGLTKAGIRESLEDKLLGTGFKRVIYNFILDKMRQRQLRKSSKLTKDQFKALEKKKKQDQKALNIAKAQKKAQDTRNQALKDALGKEEADKIIESENAENQAEIIERDKILAEGDKEQQGLEAAQLEEQSAADGDGGKTGAESDGDGGKTGAEADKAAAEASDQSKRQTNALEKIAAHITGGGMGGKGGDGGGESSGDGGGGMLAKLGGGIGSLGKGIGVFLKSIGSGAGKLLISLAQGFAALGKALGPIGKGIGMAIAGILKGFASGVMAFANPFVIAGLAVFTLGMIGLGYALRVAAPAFEAFAPVLIKIADVIGNVLMTAIKGIPAIFESIGSVIKSVGGVIIGIVEAVGGAVGGVVTSIAEGIATVVNAFKGDAMAEANAAIKQAEAATALIESQTSSIERLAKIDSTVLQLTAAGIQAIGEAMQSIGGGVKIPFFTKESPVAGLIELAKNSGGITAAATAVSKFVKNAALFKEGFEMDDSVTENIKKVVDVLGSGDKAGLTSIERVINAINELDTDKISAISAMTIPKIPDMMPSSAESYERVFAALKKTQPSLLENAGNAIFAAAKGMFGPKEPKQNAGGASGKSNPKMGGMPAAANDIKKSASGGGKTKVRVKLRGPASKGRFIGFKKMDSDELDAAYKSGKISREDYSGAARKLKDKKSSGNSKRTYKVNVRTGSGGKFEMMNMKEIGQAFKDKKISKTTRNNARTRLEQFQSRKEASFRLKDASSNMQNGRAAAIGQGATRASSASSGGSPTIVAPSTTNISSPTNNSSSYSTPMSNMPVSPAAQIIRNSLNF